MFQHEFCHTAGCLDATSPNTSHYIQYSSSTSIGPFEQCEGFSLSVEVLRSHAWGHSMSHWHHGHPTWMPGNTILTTMKQILYWEQTSREIPGGTKQFITVVSYICLITIQIFYKSPSNIQCLEKSKMVYIIPKLRHIYFPTVYHKTLFTLPPIIPVYNQNLQLKNIRRQAF